MSTLPALGDLDTLATSRGAWHRLAEHVMAPARYRVDHHIGLGATPGGVGTPEFGDQEQVRIDHGDLVVMRGTDTTTSPITTVAAAAASVGITPGAPTEVYTPATPLEPDAPLVIDASAADALAAWFALGETTLEALRGDAGDADDPSQVQLWPEHFDLGLELGEASRNARGTFGASPGDAVHPEPYLYVTRWPGVPDDPFWDEAAFPGASIGYRRLAGEPDAEAAALQFFARARAVLNGPST